jgi:hypothetical protein
MADHWESLPWFCRQQILLFLAATSPIGVDIQKALEQPETAEYARVLAFLQGQFQDNADKWAPHAVLARQSYLDAGSAARLLAPQLTPDRINRLTDLAPSVAEELLVGNQRLRRLTSDANLKHLSLPENQPMAPAWGLPVPLVEEARRWNCRLRDEASLLAFAIDWLSRREQMTQPPAPAVIQVSFVGGGPNSVTYGEPVGNPLFEAPEWCPNSQKWRFELGLTLRFIITGQSDATE